MASFNPIELQKALKGASYPASKDELIELARSNGGNDDVISLLEGVGDDRFETPADVTEAVSQASKGRS